MQQLKALLVAPASVLVRGVFAERTPSLLTTSHRSRERPSSHAPLPACLVSSQAHTLLRGGKHLTSGMTCVHKSRHVHQAWGHRETWSQQHTLPFHQPAGVGPCEPTRLLMREHRLMPGEEPRCLSSYRSTRPTLHGFRQIPPAV